MRFFLVAIFLYGLAAPVSADDRLQPEAADFADYHATEMRVFREAYAGDVVARVVVEPSFQHEYAIALALDGGAYRLFVLEPSEQIWSYTVLKMMKDGSITTGDDKGKATTADEIKKLEDSLPAHPELLKLTRCEIAIPPDVAARVIAAWKLMLTTTVATTSSGLDGEFYHFALRDKDNTLAGVTWSPVAASNPGRLVDMAFALRDACKTHGVRSLSAISQLADDIKHDQR